MAQSANPFVLPTHPTMRHPHTGARLQAIGLRANGRPIWPIMGASPDDGQGTGTGQGGAGGSGAGSAGAGDGTQGGTETVGTNGAGGNAVDDKGRDLGFPKDTPVAEMTDAQQAAYWRNQSRKHQGRFDSLVGDRSFDDVKADLDAYAKVQREQQTPAEQALADAREEGRKEARTAERTASATAVFRGALEAGGVTGDDLDELVSNFNVANYISDDGVDTTKITSFAKRFTTAPGTGSTERRRDFGGGNRGSGSGQKQRGAGGKAEAEKRFGKQSKSGE